MKGNIKSAVFTGAFVGIITGFIELSSFNLDVFIKILIAGLSALVGGMIGSKLFPNKKNT
nr:hypothetical protein [Tissierella sp.]